MASILIVDDYPPSRRLLAAILSAASHRVAESADGVEALAKVRAEHFDLVICDIFMPNMNGYEFVTQLRSDPALAATKVIFWTASLNEPEIQSLAQGCGVRHLLGKPEEQAAVLATVTAALNETSPLPGPEPGSGIDRANLNLLMDKMIKKMKALESRRTGRPVRPVLVVEDNPMDLDFMLQAFEENNIANPVQICRDGEEALQYIDAHQTAEDPDLPLLVLLDLRLPKVDGLDVLRHGQQHPVWKQVPFVIVTTSTQNSDISRAYELGANSFIVKPVDFASFAEVVKHIKVYWLLDNEPPFPSAKLEK